MPTSSSNDPNAHPAEQYELTEMTEKNCNLYEDIFITVRTKEKIVEGDIGLNDIRSAEDHYPPFIEEFKDKLNRPCKVDETVHPAELTLVGATDFQAYFELD